MATYVFNHDLSDCTDEKNLQGIAGIWQYSGRAWVLSQATDIIMLSKNLKPHVDFIQAHYRRVGLEVTQNIVWDDSFESAQEILQQNPSHKLSTFYFGKRAQKISPDQQRFTIVDDMNSKNTFIRHCVQQGYPVLETRIYDCKHLLFRQGLSSVGLDYPFLLKPSNSVSGIGIEMIADSAHLKKILGTYEDGVPFQLQQAAPTGTIFCNVQYVYGQGVVTEQVLDGMVHAGNKFPATCISPQKILDVTNPLAEELITEGLKGVFAFDVAVTPHGGIYLIECNPRFNGGTYPYFIAKRLDANQWIGKNFYTKFTSYSGIPSEDFLQLEYSRKKGHGFVIFNWGTISDQKLGVLLIGDEEQQVRLEQQLKIFLS